MIKDFNKFKMPATKWQLVINDTSGILRIVCHAIVFYGVAVMLTVVTVEETKPDTKSYESNS